MNRKHPQGVRQLNDKTMAHIHLKNKDLPGIIGLMHYRPETAAPLNALAELLLRGPSTLSPAEREIIASSVSWWNGCRFCHSAHGAAAAAHLGRTTGFLDEIKAGLPHGLVSAKLRALLAIAERTQQGGSLVSTEDVAAARAEGATDLEIHDTVLIAAAFCMFNRYVDGLGTWCPDADEAYASTGERLAFQGYLNAIPA